jgi:glyoxylase-like metal-dependent hydrolase (beta-lactamase superfamily II)
VTSLGDRGRVAGLGLVAALAPLGCVSAGPAPDGTADGSPRALAGGEFPSSWGEGGPACAGEPPLRVHAYEPGTFILRQSLCSHFEAPFMYLLFGRDRALLVDTGASEVGLTGAVAQLMAGWQERPGGRAVDLLVCNTHGHGDHVAGNAGLAAARGATVVGATADRVASFFELDTWPRGAAELDLGGRVLDVIPTPGHHPSHVAIYDRQTGLLLTGDTLYPGRLYIADFPAYQDSIERLVRFAEQHPVRWILGAHIEMSRQPGQEFPGGATHHPDEHALQLGHAHLLELRDALAAMQERPVRQVRDDFVIVPLR